jgi:hypothetical protein
MLDPYEEWLRLLSQSGFVMVTYARVEVGKAVQAGTAEGEEDDPTEGGTGQNHS